MSASLVGSEMCIRDSLLALVHPDKNPTRWRPPPAQRRPSWTCSARTPTRPIGRSRPSATCRPSTRPSRTS
eukprot:488318-Alexandrium_andersonii.AAC.1